MRDIWRSIYRRNVAVLHLFVVMFVMVVCIFQSVSPTVVLAQGHLIRRGHTTSQRIPGHLVPLLQGAKSIGPTPGGMLMMYLFYVCCLSPPAVFSAKASHG